MPQLLLLKSSPGIYEVVHTFRAMPPEIAFGHINVKNYHVDTCVHTHTGLIVTIGDRLGVGFNDVKGC